MITESLKAVGVTIMNDAGQPFRRHCVGRRIGIKQDAFSKVGDDPKHICGQPHPQETALSSMRRPPRPMRRLCVGFVPEVR
jgi:hypothetical protein